MSMSDLGFMAESVATALTGLLVSDTYAAMRPRLSAILNRSQSDGGPRIEELDRLRGTDPATLQSAVQAFVSRLAATDAHLLRQVVGVLGDPEHGIHQNIYDNQFTGPTQMGGIQIVNMREVDHEPEL